MDNNFTSLGQELQSLTKRFKMDTKAAAVEILNVFNALFSAENNLKASRLYKDTLYVTVDSPALAQILSFQTHKMLSQLAMATGKDTVKKMVFQVGKLDQSDDIQEQVIKASHTLTIDPDKIELDKEKVQEIKQLIKSISDPELKQKMESYLISMYKRQVAIEQEGQNQQSDLTKKRWKY